MAKKKIDQRTVEVKAMSGFEFCLPLRASLHKGKVEYEFLVGNDEGALKSELFARQLEGECNG